MVNPWPLARERGYSLLSYFHFPGMCLLLWTMVNLWPLAGERGYSEKFPRKQILGSVSAAWSEFHRASNFSTRKNPFVFSSSSNLKIRWICSSLYLGLPSFWNLYILRWGSPPFFSLSILRSHQLLICWNIVWSTVYNFLNGKNLFKE